MRDVPGIRSYSGVKSVALDPVPTGAAYAYAFASAALSSIQRSGESILAISELGSTCVAASPSKHISHRSNGRTGSSTPSRPSPEAVLAYLARYTHRVAISNSRLVALDQRGVTFRYKDYRRDGQARYRTMSLSADEFIRRFLLHVLPKGFHRIRHYGLLASASCKTNIARARELIAAPMPGLDPPAAHDTADPHTTDHRPPCPCCGGRMIIVEVFARRLTARSPVFRRRDRDLMR
jgi:hypothetical protein